jgi:hypothetical protein
LEEKERKELFNCTVAVGLAYRLSGSKITLSGPNILPNLESLQKCRWRARENVERDQALGCDMAVNWDRQNLQKNDA